MGSLSGACAKLPESVGGTYRMHFAGTEAGLNWEHLGKQEGAAVEIILQWGLVVPGRVAGDRELDPYVVT